MDFTLSEIPQMDILDLRNLKANVKWLKELFDAFRKRKLFPSNYNNMIRRILVFHFFMIKGNQSEKDIINLAYKLNDNLDSEEFKAISEFIDAMYKKYLKK